MKSARKNTPYDGRKLLSSLRLIQAADTTQSRKLEIALEIVGCGNAPSYEGFSTSHATRILLDFVHVSMIPRGEQPTLATDERYWVLLLKVLEAAHPDLIAPPSQLLQALTAACRSDAQPPSTTSAANSSSEGTLPTAVARVLHILRSKFSLTFRPSLEACINSVAALLERLESSEGCSNAAGWGHVALEGIRMLSCMGVVHPNPRKVFTAAVPRLLLPLLRVAVLEDCQQSPGSPDQLDDWQLELSRAACASLQGVLFHAAHVDGYYESAKQLAELTGQGGAPEDSHAAAKRPAKKKKKSSTEDLGGEEPSVEAASSASAPGRPYQSHLFDALRGVTLDGPTTMMKATSWVYGEDGCNCLRIAWRWRDCRSVPAPALPALAAGRALLVWLVVDSGPQRTRLAVSGDFWDLRAMAPPASVATVCAVSEYCTAVHGLTTELAATSHRRSWGKRPSSDMEAPGEQAGVHAFTTLLVLLEPLELVMDLSLPQDWGRRVTSVGVAAALLTQAADARMYQPAQDPSRVHWRRLERHCGLVMQLWDAARAEPQAEACEATEAEVAALAAAAVECLSALTRLDARLMEPHLGAVLPVLWAASSARAATAARAFACQLVRSFAVIRQLLRVLNTMYGSLASALSEPPSRRGRFTVAAACLSDVLAHPEFIDAVTGAVQGAPPLQAAALVNSLEAAMSSWHAQELLKGEALPASTPSKKTGKKRKQGKEAGGMGDSEGMGGTRDAVLGCLGDLGVAVLEGLRVEPQAAAAVQRAVRGVLERGLAPLAQRALPTAYTCTAWGARDGGDDVGPQSCAASATLVLRLHHAAVSLLEQCQDLTVDPAGALIPSHPYLHNLAPGDGAQGLPELVAAVRKGQGAQSPPSLRLALAYAAIQRLNQLREGREGVWSLEGEEAQAVHRERCQLAELLMAEASVVGGADLGSEAPWNGVSSTVTHASVGSALWMCIARSADLWASHAPEAAVVAFLRQLLRRQLVQQPLTAEAEATGGGAGDGVSTVWMQAQARDAHLYEIQELRDAYPEAVLQELQQALCEALPGHLGPELWRWISQEAAEAEDTMCAELASSGSPASKSSSAAAPISSSAGAADLAAVWSLLGLVAQIPAGYMIGAGAASLTQRLLLLELHLIRPAALPGTSGAVAPAELRALASARLCLCTLAQSDEGAVDVLLRPAALRCQFAVVARACGTASGAEPSPEARKLLEAGGNLLEVLCEAAFERTGRAGGAAASLDESFDVLLQEIEAPLRGIAMRPAKPAPVAKAAVNPASLFVPRSIKMGAAEDLDYLTHHNPPSSASRTPLANARRCPSPAASPKHSPAAGAGAELAVLGAATALRAACSITLAAATAARASRHTTAREEDDEEDDEKAKETTGAVAGTSTAALVAECVHRLEPALLAAMTDLDGGAAGDTASKASGGRSFVGVGGRRGTGLEEGVLSALAPLLQLHTHWADCGVPAPGMSTPAALSSSATVPVCMRDLGRHLSIAGRLLLRTSRQPWRGSLGLPHRSQMHLCMQYIAAAALTLTRVQPPPPPDVYLRVLVLHLHLLTPGKAETSVQEHARGSLRELVRAMGRSELMLVCRSLERALQPPTTGAHTAALRALQVLLTCGLRAKSLKVVGGFGERFTAALIAFLSRLSPAGSAAGRSATEPSVDDSSAVIAAPILVARDPGTHELHAAQLAVSLLAVLLSKPDAYELSKRTVAQIMQLPGLLQHATPLLGPQFVDGIRGDHASLYRGCCDLVALSLRHRSLTARHAMGTATAGVRSLLAALAALAQHAAEVAATPLSAGSSTTGAGGAGMRVSLPDLEMAVLSAAGALSRVYEEVAAEKKGSGGKYCTHLLADFTSACCEWSSGGAGGGEASQLAALPQPTAMAVRPGVYALMAACKPLDLQSLSANLGTTRRMVLSQLKEGYEREYKYTGKV
ncbi:hypothetical protein CYMTET_56352 [Cymbomonas tetramitiformis]|uniref:Nucleolar 27S pre-rRNA processing Urb2/Npa2 C-terminal domain-containing protein n=1 Tax=Cymbomonas tetramitiformis TaxID=36881 RepID=A0AAE0EMN2_9CHLO|nr:hypothetical protein CYMTET_56352 [Cymbomonas tetramitiformis]